MAKLNSDPNSYYDSIINSKNTIACSVITAEQHSVHITACAKAMNNKNIKFISKMRRKAPVLF